jgi:hypothetical protein
MRSGWIGVEMRRGLVMANLMTRSRLECMNYTPSGWIGIEMRRGLVMANLMTRSRLECTIMCTPSG